MNISNVLTNYTYIDPIVGNVDVFAQYLTSSNIAANYQDATDIFVKLHLYTNSCRFSSLVTPILQRQSTSKWVVPYVTYLISLVDGKFNNSCSSLNIPVEDVENIKLDTSADCNSVLKDVGLTNESVCIS